MIEQELRRLGAAGDALSRHGSELDAVLAALRWARDGDLLLLTTHAQRDDVIALMERLEASGWKPGDEGSRVRQPRARETSPATLAAGRPGPLARKPTCGTAEPRKLAPTPKNRKSQSQGHGECSTVPVVDVTRLWRVTASLHHSGVHSQHTLQSSDNPRRDRQSGGPANHERVRTIEDNSPYGSGRTLEVDGGSRTRLTVQERPAYQDSGGAGSANQKIGADVYAPVRVAPLALFEGSVEVEVRNATVARDRYLEPWKDRVGHLHAPAKVAVLGRPNLINPNTVECVLDGLNTQDQRSLREARRIRENLRV